MKEKRVHVGYGIAILIDSLGLAMTSVKIGRHEAGWLTEPLGKIIFKRSNFLERWDLTKLSHL